MGGWLGHATSLFQQSPPPSEPFEVQCDCGGKVAGRRMNVYQKPACPICERPVFVLPANVYPRPKVKLKNKAAKSADENKAKRGPSTVVSEEGSGTVSTKPGDRASLHKAISDPNKLLEPPVRIVTPLRMVTTAIILVSALTIGGLWHRYRIENAKAVVAKSADAGMAALRDEEFIKAAQELEKARRAVDVLGRTDLAANDIRRFSREATTLANLATSSFTEILQETLASGRPGQTEPLHWSSSNKGAWAVFDTAVLPASQGKDRCLIDGLIVLGEANVRIEIDSPLLRKVTQVDDAGESPRVIFSAQLEQLSAPTGQPATAVLTLNGKTVFLWTSYETYAAMGYRPVDADAERETRSLLERQLDAGKK